MRGRKRTPEHLRKLHSTFRPDRHNSEPAYPVGGDEPPEFLTPRGAAIWTEYRGLMVAAGTFRATDAHLLALYADCLDRFHEAIKLVRIEGMTVTARNGATAEHPSLRTARNALESARKLADALGFGPVARARTRGELPPADDLDAFLAGK